MTRSSLERMVSVWSERMNLTHWRFKFEWDKPLPNDATTLAQVERGAGLYDDAEFRFHPNYIGWDTWYANTVIVHELTHLITRDLEMAYDLDGLLPKAAATLYDRRIDHEIEGVVDRVAHLLVALGGVVEDWETDDRDGGSPDSGQRSNDPLSFQGLRA